MITLITHRGRGHRSFLYYSSAASAYSITDIAIVSGSSTESVVYRLRAHHGSGDSHGWILGGTVHLTSHK